MALVPLHPYSTTVNEFMTRKGLAKPLIVKYRSGFGRLAKREFIRVYGRPPRMVPENHYGRTVLVCGYPPYAIHILESVWIAMGLNKAL